MGEEMKREFLKNLGIDNKEIIDAIMDENSSDIGKAKGELQTYKDKVAELESQITTKDTEIQNLQKSVGDVDALNQKITQLETDKTNLQSELDTKVNQIQKTHAIESAVRDAKAKNIKAVMGLLEADKITFKDGKLEGLAEQLENLTKSEESSFLFGDTVNAPSGASPENPPSNDNNPPTSMSFAEAISKALGSK